MAGSSNTFLGREISEKTAMIVLGALVAVAVIVVLILQFLPKGTAEPEETGSSTGSTPSVSASSNPGKSGTKNSTPAPSKATETPDDGVSGDPQEKELNTAMPKANTENEKLGPPADKVNSDQPEQVDGKYYVTTNEAIQEWSSVRAVFLLGLTGEGNIYEATKGTATPEVEEKLKELAPGAYKDLKFPDEYSEYAPPEANVEPYAFTEAFPTVSGEIITVKVQYFYDGVNGQWRVSDFSVK